jgi:hypothetical protein
MTLDKGTAGKKWDRASLLRALTSAETQVYTGAETGLLVWIDIIRVKSSLYFLNESALAVKEAISFVAAEAVHIIRSIFDDLEHNNFSVADAAHVAATSAVSSISSYFAKVRAVANFQR